MLALRKPYLLFMADVADTTFAKTGQGVWDWAPEACHAQWRLTDQAIDLGLPEMCPAEAATAGAKSLLIGAAPIGGQLPDAWVASIVEAIDAGLDIISGLHTSLNDIEPLAKRAKERGVTLHDVRRPANPIPVGSGRKRTGQRLLTVGTDCALGKKYTALALTAALKEKGVASDFRATGQTGIMIAGAGIPIDSVVADFISGAAEQLSPDASPDHWDVIEGQGSLFHPAYAGVTLGLIHGSQPDVLILCHDPTREHVNKYPDFALPELGVAIDQYLQAARITNPSARFAGISLNTSRLEPAERERTIAATADRYGLPCFDPLKSDLNEVVAQVLS